MPIGPLPILLTSKGSCTDASTCTTPAPLNAPAAILFCLAGPMPPYRSHDRLTFQLCHACVEEKIDHPLLHKLLTCHHMDVQHALVGRIHPACPRGKCLRRGPKDPKRHFDSPLVLLFFSTALAFQAVQCTSLPLIRRHVAQP